MKNLFRALLAVLVYSFGSVALAGPSELGGSGDGGLSPSSFATTSGATITTTPTYYAGPSELGGSGDGGL